MRVERGPRITIESRLAEGRPSRPAIRRLLRHVLAGEGCGRGVDLRFVGERTIRRLNREWLGEDRVTDVLAFPMGTPPPGPDPREVAIGTVLVCLARCRKQAQERGIAFHREVARMMVHGTLHLLGHDHGRAGPAARMRGRERRYLSWYAREGSPVLEGRR